MEVESYHYDVNNTNKHFSNPDKPKLEQCIDSIISKEGYISCDVQIKTITTDGGSYLGKLYEINIKGKTVHGDKETPIFAKTMAPDANKMELLSLENIYNKELFAYTELFKVFNELQDEAEVPTNERFKTAKSYDESYSQAIILENVTKRGFKGLYRMDCVTLETAEECIKILARFHGLSFVVKAKKPVYFEGTIKSLDHPFLLGTEVWQEFSSKFTKTSLGYLDEGLRKKVEDKIPCVLEKYSQYFQDEDSKCCVCHGDYRPNNVMVKKEDDKTVDAIALDYQLIHYGNPILDIFFFIYIGTDCTFRRKHLSYLKDLYYETLENYLLYFSVDVESVYPRERFEREFLKKRDYGLMVSVLFLPFFFVSEGNAPDILKETVRDLDIIVDERFKDVFAGVIQEFIELGHLSSK